jgi:AraC-like DNA-binding protein
VNKYVKSDLNVFIRHVVAALKPIAKAENIDLSFSLPRKATTATFLASLLAHDVAHIICKLIEFTPEHEKISVSIEKVDSQKCKVVIENTGINTSRVGEITHACKFPVTTIETSMKSTRYEVEVDLHEEFAEPEQVVKKITEPNFTAEYYGDVKKRLRSHFIKPDSFLEKLMEQNPREAMFLKKVNTLVLENMENRQFDTNHLSVILNMSRTQLFRRLKPIVHQSPGSYIRMIKLHKAKELFETTNLRISEVAHKTGFETASHFTKVFTKHYGKNPSHFAGKKNPVTNE